MEKHRDFLLDESMIQEEKADFLCFSQTEVSQLISALKTQAKLREHIQETEYQLTDNGAQETQALLIEDLEFDKISPTAFVEIAKAPEEAQLEIAKKVVDEGLTVKQTQQLIKEVKEEKIKLKDFKSGVEWCDYGINIYSGCYHDCTYCYAKAMNKRFGWIENWTEPKKRDIDLEDLAERLEKLPAGSFFFCSSCDAYQPINDELNWAREVLQVMLPSKHHIIILTKNASVERDFDLVSQYDNVEVAFTITSLDDEKYKKYEPNSSPPSEKIRVLKKAHEMGIKTMISIEPWILGDHTNPLEIIKVLKDSVDRWIIGVANYMGFDLEEYRPFIPELISYLIENNINYRLKAELDRVIKSYPILTRKKYEESIMQQVGDQ